MFVRHCLRRLVAAERHARNRIPSPERGQFRADLAEPTCVDEQP